MSSNSRILPNYEAVYEFVVTDDDAHDNANSMLVNNAQCNDRTPLWISPSLCAVSKSSLSSHHTLYLLHLWFPSIVYSFVLYYTTYICSVQDSATELSKCSTSQILAPKYDFVFDSMEDEEAMKSMLTNFMTLASLTRDVEMQKGEYYSLHKLLIWIHCFDWSKSFSTDKELCDASNESVPWDIHMCDVSGLISEYITSCNEFPWP